MASNLARGGRSIYTGATIEHLNGKFQGEVNLRSHRQSRREHMDEQASEIAGKLVQARFYSLINEKHLYQSLSITEEEIETALSNSKVWRGQLNSLSGRWIPDACVFEIDSSSYDFKFGTPALQSHCAKCNTRRAITESCGSMTA